MSLNDDHKSLTERPLDVDLKIDQICDAFELSYQTSPQRPRIEDYLDETIGDIATQVVELVLVEVAYRKKAGDAPSLDEYASRFPEHSGVLQQISDRFRSDDLIVFRSPPAFNNLESFEFIGSGSFGAVWKAWHSGLCRFVAVKTPLRPVPTQTDRDLMQREAKLIAKASHPYIVPVHDFCEQQSRVYVVYEFIAGMTLQQRLEGAPFSHTDAARLCMMIAEGLHCVHEHGIVHRDLKPANIMLDRWGKPRIMDFGLAKVIDGHSTIGHPGVVLGTPAYMSPEQAAGNSEGTDARSDIYSLGAILHELVLGKMAFQRGRQTVLQTDTIKTTATSTTPMHIASELMGNHVLEQIWRKCMQREKHFRYQSAAELVRDLKKFIDDEPVYIPPVTRWRRGWLWLSRHPLAAILPLLTSLPLLLFAAPRGTRENPIAEAVPVIEQPAPEMPQKVHLATDPPGLTVAVLQCDPTTGEVDRLHVVKLVAATPATIEIMPGRYLLNVTHGGQSLEVHRSVPGFNGAWPSRRANWNGSRLVPREFIGQWSSFLATSPSLRWFMFLEPKSS